jgi:hypothetical protein
MKRIITAALLCCVVAAHAQTYVPGYFRKDGTYVEGHTKSLPNDTRMDNFGARDNIYGNQNPYTGQRGSERSELSPPTIYNSRPQPQTQRQCFQDVYGRMQCQ